MALNDLDTWWVKSSVFIGADFESGTHFALNNDPEAQDGFKVRIVTPEMSQSHGNGPWYA